MTKIENGVYRIGEYIAYETNRPKRIRWALGKPIDWDDASPETEMLKCTLSYHSTLLACRHAVRRINERLARNG